MAVREDAVVRPDGSDGIFGVVEMVDGATVAAVSEAGEICLVREFKYAVGRETLELISGGMDAGETPVEAARRELREEVGLVAAEWIDLGVVDPFTSAVRSRNYLFLALGLTEMERSPDAGEVVVPVWMPFAEVVEMVMTGEITHGGSCVAVLKAGRVLGRRGFSALGS